jgi:hypothetical protein
LAPTRYAPPGQVESWGRLRFGQSIKMLKSR